jgi:tyrosine-protein kinase Etk/Wzc
MSGDRVAMETDLTELLGTVLGNWRRLAIGTAVGAVIGVGVVLFVPARFDGRALVLIRTKNDPTAALASKAGPLAELAPSALGGSFKDELETELALLKSRAVAAVVTDSLRLQLRPKSPARVAPLSLIDSVRTTGRFAPYTTTLKPGRNEVTGGAVWVRADAPSTVKVKLVDRDDAIDDVIEHLEVKKEGGEVVRVAYTGRDSLTSATVPNLAIATYLERRRTVDRGLNQRRFEFMSSASDSINRDLVAAVSTRRKLQDQSGVPAMEPAIGALVEQVAELESKLGLQRAEEAALDSLLRVTKDPRQLATFPALLRSPLVNELVGQLAQLDVRRTTLLASVPATSPAVQALDASRDSIVVQLVPLARTYLQALATERGMLEKDLNTVRARLRALPGAGEALLLAESRLGQLAAMDNGIGAQVLQARLAALTEGGDVRLVDPAVPPRKVTFPRPLPTIAIAAVLGLLATLALILVAPMPSSRSRA